MKTLLLFTIVAFISCASDTQKKKLSAKALVKKQLRALKTVRPLLNSDEFDYMKCQDVGYTEAEFVKQFDSKHNQIFGVMELRDAALEKEANIISLSHQIKNNRVLYKANLYRCQDVRDASFADEAGMCKASKEFIVRFRYPDDNTRAVGEETLRQMARYYAIEHFYKTFHVKKIKYSYTKKEFSAHASFYKCL